MFKQITLGAAAAIAAFTALPAAAEARHRDGYYDNGRYESSYRGDRYSSRDRRYDERYDRGRNCRSGTTGTIVGGAAGALLGREIARGNGRYGRRGSGTTGTILGGVVGALAGRAVTRTC